MAVYQGVLERISSGSVIAPGGTGVRINAWGNRAYRTGVDNRVRREFVEIGGQHIRNVVLTPYQDELLAAAVGEEVAISVIGPEAAKAGSKGVIAMQTLKGMDRPGLGAMVFGTVWGLFLRLIGSIILGGLTFGILAATVSKTLGIVCGLTILALILIRYVLRVSRIWHARNVSLGSPEMRAGLPAQSS